MFRLGRPLDYLALLSLVAPALVAQARNADIGGLTGILGMNVLVEPLQSELALQAETVRTDVELRLRQMRVRVLTDQEATATGGATLYVNVIANCAAAACAANVRLALFQDAYLARDGSLFAIAHTWERGHLLVCSQCRQQSLTRGIRDGLRDLVDQFVNEYLKWNPR
jgi:hypothetical protein